MPSGKAHRQLGYATTPVLILAAWTVSGFSLSLDTWMNIGTVCVGYLINPLLLSPDMDLVHSAPANEWKAAEPLWWGYQMLIHKGGGRNPLSHWPPLSSLLRIFYLWLILFIVGMLIIGIVNLISFGLFEQIIIPWEWIKRAFRHWVMVFTFPAFWHFVWGVCLADAVHICADLAYSYMRK